ncbi:MAG: H-NS histone family protein [Pseudomonadota bacterium]|nr:H-NS histone family protein [Pseudomonadota bacterium]
MSNTIEGIDLSSYSVEQLNALVDMANKEIAHKEQTRRFEVRQQMEDLASSVGMSVEELLALNSKKKKAGKTVGKVKFRNPANAQQTWTGRGKRPRWLQDELDRGADLNDFAVSP